MRRILKLVSLFLVFCVFSSCSTVKIVKTKEITNTITQTAVILEKNYSENEDFTQFLSRFKESYIIPGLLEGVIPQGLCYDATNGYILITGYYEDSVYPSVLMAINEADGSFVGAYPLKTTDGNDCFGHVGGIAASENTVYITTEGECYTFPIEALSDLSNGTAIQFTGKFKLHTKGSFACIYNNVLWSGDFIQSSEKEREAVEDIVTLESGETFYAFCEGYELIDGLPDAQKINTDSSGYIPDCVIAVPEQVQGMAFSPEGKILFSTSYGRKNNSKIYIFNDILSREKFGTKNIEGREVDLYVCSNSDLDTEIIGLPMAEAMANTPKGIYLNFESGANKYRDGGGKFPTDTLFYMQF